MHQKNWTASEMPPSEPPLVPVLELVAVVVEVVPVLVAVVVEVVPALLLVAVDVAEAVVPVLVDVDVAVPVGRPPLDV